LPHRYASIVERSMNASALLATRIAVRASPDMIAAALS